MERFLAKAAAFLLLLVVAGSGPGCHGQTATDDEDLKRTTPVVQQNQTESPPSASQAQGAEADTVRAGETLVRQSWFALYMGDAKIGHVFSRTLSLERAGRPLVRIESEQQFSILRNGDRVDQKIRTRSLESPEGDVLELYSEIGGSGSAVVTHALRKGERLEIAFTTDDKTTSSSIPWRPEWRGFDAEQQIIRAKLPKPGEVITFSSLLPVLNVVGQTRLTAKKWEDVDTPYGRENLLRVESQVSTADGTFDSVMWCDKKGELRSFSQTNLNITAHQTVKSLALAENKVVDLYEVANIKVKHPMPQPHQARRAVYRARLRNRADPLQVFPSDHSQRVTMLDKDEFQIEVIAVSSAAPQEHSPQSPPEPADLAPNALIQSDDPRIQELLSQVQGPQDDPVKWALACESFVSRTIENKQLTEAFLSAAEVARTRTGDCTEHAVLTAALCRAHGIAARVATGLVAYEDIYAFHMWNEVWIGDRWMPIDATLGRGGIGAGHIKLGVSNLEGVSPFAALSPVLEVMGALDLDVVSWE